MAKIYLNILLWAMFLSAPGFLMAQYQNVWAFGVNAGLDFNNVDSNGLPASISTKNFSAEGTVSVCDDQGKLLFYSDGVCVYNRQHQLMPNAPIRNLKDWLPPGFERAGLSSATRSSAQSSIIIQYPGKPHLYYLFSLTGETGGTPSNAKGQLYMSLIDMRRDNGLGDIVDSCNGVYLGNGYSEAISSILGLERIWLIIPRKKTLNNDLQNHSILAFPVTYDGFINEPVENIIPSSPTENLDLIYSVIPNNQGTQIAYAGRSMGFRLLDFDKRNGKITRIRQLDSIVQTAIAFSPNDKILYTYTQQINLETLEKYTWNNSRTTTSYSSQIKLGPDKRIYYLMPMLGQVGVILEPNIFKFDSGYLASIDFIERTSGQFGVPNVYNTIVAKNSYQKLCINRGDTLKPQTSLDYFESKWNDTILADYLIPQQSGLYYVKYIGYGAVYIDSFEVDILNEYSVYITEDSIPCGGAQENLVYIKSDGKVPYTTLWSNVDNQQEVGTGDTLSHLGIGNYKVTIRQSLCTLEMPVRIYQKKYIPQLELNPSCNKQTNGAVELKILNDDINSFTKIWMTSTFDTIAINTDKITNLNAGKYYLHLSSVYCDTVLPFTIAQIYALVDFEIDSFLCYGQEYEVLNNSAAGLKIFEWYENNVLVGNNREYTYKANSTPFVHLKLIGRNEFCVDSLSFTSIIDTPVHTTFSTSGDSICTGQSITFAPQTNETARELHWHFGEHHFAYDRLEPISHAFDKAGIAPVTLRTRYRACPDTRYADSIYVYPIPEVYLGSDSSICYQGETIMLQNLSPLPGTIYTYTWSTGDTAAQLRISSPGSYSLKVQAEPLGCTGYGTIEISKDCFMDIPNAFTPNGDGINDYFFSGKWLRNGVEKFHLQIFNRWGQLLYETQQGEGLGWDGRHNQVEQPSGVYIYHISVSYKNGRNEQYKGNVTLIR